MKLLKSALVLLLFVSASSISWGQSSPELQMNYSNFEKINKVEIYPNPTVDFINVEIKNSTLKDPKIEIFNIIGNAVEVEIEKTSNNNYQVNVKNLPSGYYLVTIKDDGALIKDMYKFLKR